MAEPTRPSPALSFGRKNWFYVPSGGFVDYLAPTAAELIAASVLDFTNMAMQSGTTSPTQSTNRSQAERRVGDTRNYERKGTTQITGGTLVYAVNPQAVAASDGKKAWEKFLGGPDGGFLVNRLNVAKATVPTAGQFVSVFPADLSESLLGEVGEAESGEVVGTCEYFIRDVIKQMVALA